MLTSYVYFPAEQFWIVLATLTFSLLKWILINLYTLLKSKYQKLSGKDICSHSRKLDLGKPLRSPSLSLA